LSENRDSQKQSIEKDFKLLIGEGNLGFYSSCEITTIFLFDKIIKKARNFFTIAVFEEKEFTGTNHSLYLTKKLIPINQRYKIGIMRYHMSIKDVEKAFAALLEGNKWSYQGDELLIGKLTPLPKQFIPRDEIKSVPLNSILKNNFFNGSYIIEFFDEGKQDLREILESDDNLKKICNHINKIIPIDLLYIKDRIGNIIFQFPSTLLSVKTRSLESWQGIEVQLAWHPRLVDIPEISIQSVNRFDGNIIGFCQMEKINNSICQIYTGNSNEMNDIIIFNRQNGLILTYISTSFLKSIHFSMHLSSPYQEPRIIQHYDQKGKLTELIKIPISYSYDSNKLQKYDYFDWISNRVYENEKKRLEKNLIFIQYGKGVNDRTRALKDLRTLINRYGEDGIYLWDPYLSCEDILNTIYYYEVAGAPMKAINSYRKKKNIFKGQDNHEDEKSYEEWVKRYRDEITRSSNHLGIDFELRCQHHQYGWSFHDRFIIFPLRYRRPKAWSLGTSINSLGKVHHILQEVGNAKMILDAFMELWEELEDPSCLIWRKK
jgi:hypothetical protein